MDWRNDVTFELVVDWRVLGLVLVCGLLLLVAARVAAQGDGQSPNGESAGADGEGQSDQGASGSALLALARGRSFYVTDANVRGNEVLDACAEGYHTASLWEIFEVSSLSYAYDHPEAETRPDSGTGPAGGWYGWIRTGGSSNANNTAGQANCSVWTNSDTGNYGTIVRLSLTWDAAAGRLTLESSTWACSGLAPVWCVEDE